MDDDVKKPLILDSLRRFAEIRSKVQLSFEVPSTDLVLYNPLTKRDDVDFNSNLMNPAELRDPLAAKTKQYVGYAKHKLKKKLAVGRLFDLMCRTLAIELVFAVFVMLYSDAFVKCTPFPPYDLTCFATVEIIAMDLMVYPGHVQTMRSFAPADEITFADLKTCAIQAIIKNSRPLPDLLFSTIRLPTRLPYESSFTNWKDAIFELRLDVTSLANASRRTAFYPVELYQLQDNLPGARTWFPALKTVKLSITLPPAGAMPALWKRGNTTDTTTFKEILTALVKAFWQLPIEKRYVMLTNKDPDGTKQDKKAEGDMRSSTDDHVVEMAMAAPGLEARI